MVQKSTFKFSPFALQFRYKTQITEVKWPSQHQNDEKGAKIDNYQIESILLSSMWLTSTQRGVCISHIVPLCEDYAEG